MCDPSRGGPPQQVGLKKRPVRLFTPPYRQLMPTASDLVSRTARSAFRTLAGELTQALIQECWENERFVRHADIDPQQGRVRRQVFDSYANGVDWCDSQQAAAALRVFEQLLRHVARKREETGRTLEHGDLVDICDALASTGYQVSSDLRIQAASTSPPITAITRRRIVDALRIAKTFWWGALDEVQFLERLYDLDAMESSDPRPQYPTARDDIIQHCISNDDWDWDWVFRDERFGLHEGPADVLLAFLAEMLHPAVRHDEAEVQRLVKILNKALAADGFELYPVEYISGLPVFAGGPRASFHGARPDFRFDKHPLLTDPRVLREHQDRIRAGLDNDPAAAIASCKELAESLFKIILDQQGVTYPASEDLPALYKRVAELLGLKAESVPDSAKASETVQKILRTLATTVQSLAELRNQLGLGHGRARPSPALARHARLALNSTVTVTEFLLDTWQNRVDRGLLIHPATSANS